MKRYKAKAEILKIFYSDPEKEFSSKDVYDKAREMGIFIPPAFNTHLSQLLKLGDIVRIRRSVYRLKNEQDKEIPRKKSWATNVFNFIKK